MGTLTIRQLEERTHARLRDLPEQNFLLALHESLAEVRGVDLQLPERVGTPPPVEF